MKNGVVVVAVVMSVASFAGMLRLKTNVEGLVRDRARLAAERLQLREDRRVLQAELAYLTEPSRMLEFARKRGYVELDMTSLERMQPMVRAVTVAPTAAVAPDVVVAVSSDVIVSGSVTISGEVVD